MSESLGKRGAPVAWSPSASAKRPLSPDEYLMALQVKADGRARFKSYHLYWKKPVSKNVADYDLDLVSAVEQGNVAALEQAVQGGKSIDACNQYGETLLHVACRTGADASFRYLLDRGASVQCCDDNGRVPLHEICRSEQPNLEMALAVLRLDTKQVHALDARNRAPLAYAPRASWEGWYHFLHEHKSLLRAWDDATAPAPASRSHSPMLATVEIMAPDRALKMRASQEWRAHASAQMHSARSSAVSSPAVASVPETRASTPPASFEARRRADSAYSDLSASDLSAATEAAKEALSVREAQILKAERYKVEVEGVRRAAAAAVRAAALTSPRRPVAQAPARWSAASLFQSFAAVGAVRMQPHSAGASIEAAGLARGSSSECGDERRASSEGDSPTDDSSIGYSMLAPSLPGGAFGYGALDRRNFTAQMTQSFDQGSAFQARVDDNPARAAASSSMRAIIAASVGRSSRVNAAPFASSAFAAPFASSAFGASSSSAFGAPAPAFEAPAWAQKSAFFDTATPAPALAVPAWAARSAFFAAEASPAAKGTSPATSPTWAARAFSASEEARALALQPPPQAPPFADLTASSSYRTPHAFYHAPGSLSWGASAAHEMLSQHAGLPPPQAKDPADSSPQPELSAFLPQPELSALSAFLSARDAMPPAGPPLPASALPTAQSPRRVASPR